MLTFGCRLMTFFKIIFFKKFFQEYRVSNSLHPDLDQGSDLGPSCLYLGYQWMKKVNASRGRVNRNLIPDQRLF